MIIIIITGETTASTYRECSPLMFVCILRGSLRAAAAEFGSRTDAKCAGPLYVGRLVSCMLGNRPHTHPTHAKMQNNNTQHTLDNHHHSSPIPYTLYPIHYYHSSSSSVHHHLLYIINHHE